MLVGHACVNVRVWVARSSWRKSRASCPKTPVASKVMGWNMWHTDSSAWRSCFLVAAWLASSLTWDDDIWMLDWAKSQHVTSQTRAWPFAQGVMVRPSGIFPSTRRRPNGSSVAGTLVAERAWRTMSFSAVCQGILLWLLQQLSPFTPEWSICMPQQGQSWGTQCRVLSRN